MSKSVEKLTMNEALEGLKTYSKYKGMSDEAILDSLGTLSNVRDELKHLRRVISIKPSQEKKLKQSILNKI